jgi:hypothetical protein
MEVGTKREYADDPFGKWRVRVFSHIMFLNRDQMTRQR